MRQQYDSYKSTGIHWIPIIPSHWQISSVGKHYQVILGKMLCPKPIDAFYTLEEYYCAGDVHFDGVNSLNLKQMWFSPEEKDKYLVKDKDLLIVEGGAGAGGCALARVSDDAERYIQNSILIARHPRNSTALLKYIIENFVRAGYIDGVCNEATFAHFTKEKVSHVPYPLMPYAEQEAISTWLDEKCEEIDAAIAKVDREIELIDELKQSEISRVVTRGLNPDAPLRPSGIDWIGDIPKHWTKSRIKNHISRSAAGVWGDDEKGNKNDIICFRIADFNYGERCLSFDKITIRNIDPKQLEGRYLSKGDLLIEKSGGGETTPVGRVVYCNYDGKATYTNFIHSISLSDNVDSRFFLYYFNMLYSNKINLLYFNQTTGLQNLQIGEYLGQPIYLPPLSEQQEIADYLDAKCAEIDELKAKLTKKRETLTELRQSIISEVVTGKRKVI